MASSKEIESAVKVASEFAGNPDSGVIAEFLRDLAASASAPAKEVRVADVKETR